VDFEWDEHKRRANIAKHGIDFADVEEVFRDRGSRDALAGGEHGEVRRVRIGRFKSRVITVVYTMRGDVLRIISARNARRTERAFYEA
jgi:uncharacterized DUF497 family protein